LPKRNLVRYCARYSEDWDRKGKIASASTSIESGESSHRDRRENANAYFNSGTRLEALPIAWHKKSGTARAPLQFAETEELTLLP